MEKSTFAGRLVEIAYAFRTDITEKMVTVYWRMLSGFDEELFDKVCDWFLTDGDRFPLIADFHKIARTKFKREITGDYTIRHD